MLVTRSNCTYMIVVVVGRLNLNRNINDVTIEAPAAYNSMPSQHIDSICKVGLKCCKLASKLEQVITSMFCHILFQVLASGNNKSSNQIIIHLLCTLHECVQRMIRQR
jgi:hypothetical protein